MKTTLLDRFKGSLIGLTVGDALGGKFEGQTAAHIHARVPSLDALMQYPAKSLWYTDDTQMMIGVAETLITYQSMEEEALCKAFVQNYVPSRGYGQGARAVLEAMEEGRDYHFTANNIFPGGSYGNGAAMRVAPIGLFFRDHPEELISQARLSALPTHTHPLGIEGAIILAGAVGYVSSIDSIDKNTFLDHLFTVSSSSVFQEKIELTRRISRPEAIIQLGNGIAAQESVITAIACFLQSPDSFEETIGHAIFLGGDTDTLAAMAGAISGAYLGIDAIPKDLIAKLEDSPKGKAYIFDLAHKLFDLYADKSGSLIL